MPTPHSSARLEFVVATSAFAFWGVIARSIDLPTPVMLAIISGAGAFTCACAGAERTQWSMGAVVVGLILSADLLLLMLAFQRVDFATVVALHYAGPILVVMLAPSLTGDTFRPKSLVLAAVGFVAVAVICGLKFEHPSPSEIAGVILALLSAITLAANILAQRWLMKSGVSYRGAVLQYNVVLTVVYAAIALFWRETSLHSFVSWRRVLAETAVAAIAGIVTQGFAMMLFNSAARRLDSETMARLSLLGPALTVATGAFFYSERPSAVQIFALLTILVVSLPSPPVDATEAAKSLGR
jgi:drug/metabolite transporter (DMT)-like permease